MPWIRRELRGNAVFVRADSSGTPLAGPDGRVDVAYSDKPGAKIYRASLRNLAPTGTPDDERPRELAGGEPGGSPEAGTSSSAAGPRSRGKRSGKATTGAAALDPSLGPPIIIYTDGACRGNPGPMGIGAVVIDGETRNELSEFLGVGTNNIAELTAILRALEAVPEAERTRPVLVHSDSSYALGLLGQGWKPKKNIELVAQLRQMAAAFPHLRLVKVLGHSGVPENERCDQLATAAAIRGY